MSLRVLCTADIHIGRSSSSDGEIPAETSALASWERIVDIAAREKPAAVVIAGDLFDGLAAQYATRPRVIKAFERLLKEGIPALAVAGNHDHSALPAFAQPHPKLFHLFGASNWEERRVGPLRFVGRSFGKELETESLLKNLGPVDGDAVTIGVVHADIDAQSPYGPTPLRDFAGRGVAAWVVGHVHCSRDWSADQPVAYPGSPQALDWGETGQHGFRWLTVDNGTAKFSEVVPVSTVRYEYKPVDLAPGESLENKLASCSADYRRESPGIESVQYRVDVRLQDGAQASLPEAATSLARDLYAVRSTLIVPNIDLEKEAEQDDARGQAARLLLGLQGRGKPDWQLHAASILQRVKTAMENERRKLNLPPEEDVDCLRHDTVNEARGSIERALRKVLFGKGGAR
jgi:DNA repair exonuclease SbcCD nuclease subunit